MERALLHLNINIVYSKVLQALSIILTNQCDTSKQVITIWSKQWHDYTNINMMWEQCNMASRHTQ